MAYPSLKGYVYPDAPRGYVSQSQFIDGLACNCGGSTATAAALASNPLTTKSASFPLAGAPEYVATFTATVNGTNHTFPINVPISTATAQTAALNLQNKLVDLLGTILIDAQDCVKVTVSGGAIVVEFKYRTGFAPISFELTTTGVVGF